MGLVHNFTGRLIEAQRPSGFRQVREECIELEPESMNPEHEAIRIDPTTEDFEIVGVMVPAIVGTRRRDGNE